MTLVFRVRVVRVSYREAYSRERSLLAGTTPALARLGSSVHLPCPAARALPVGGRARVVQRDDRLRDHGARPTPRARLGWVHRNRVVSR